MKAKITIHKHDGGFFAEIKIKHDFLSGGHALISKDHASKGQLKRKVFQFCGELNLDCEFI
jgi:hypothetical protein